MANKTKPDHYGYLIHVGAVSRIDDSSILLNLDHPDFHAKRERLKARLSAKAAFSSATNGTYVARHQGRTGHA